MNKKLIILILVLVFAGLLAGAYFLYGRLGQQIGSQQLSTQSATEAATQAATQPTQAATAGTNLIPDITVYDADGNAVQLHDYFGKPIVLNFWASWCGPCKSEMPDFQNQYQLLGQDIQFLMVNMTDGNRETVEAASSFIAQQGYTFPVLYDTAGSAAMVYGIYSLPTTFFIDAQGNFVTYATGAISEELLLKGIDMIR